jgi:hypothetical protein
MQLLLNKFTTLNYPKHYLLYCLTFMLYATSMTGIGPLIPISPNIPATSKPNTLFSSSANPSGF